MKKMSTEAIFLPAFMIFERGFRPFFLLAGVHAALSLTAWIAVLKGWIDAPEGWPPATLHAHEMLFGFAAAAFAGFLLTAVPSWTNTGYLRGPKLVLLVLLWLTARVAAASGIDPRLYAALDIAFIAALLVSVSPGIIKRKLKRNYVILLVLSAILAASAAQHLAVLGTPSIPTKWGNEIGLALFVLLIALIGGRIVPPFTIGGMRMAGRSLEIEPTPTRDRIVIAATAAWVVTLALGLHDAVVAVAAAFAAFANGARLAHWRSLATLRVPLVWILHLGYAWVVLGLALSAAAGFALIPKAAALHALGAGGVATMILAVMSRAALGHTGRTLVAGKLITAGYVLVTLGAAGRVIASILENETQTMLAIAGFVWAAGFALYVVAYAPILCRPRIDGRPG